MPAGLVRSGNYRKGTPIVLPHQFGNVVAGSNEPFGNTQPQSNPRISGNPVDWTPSPAHFGNQVSFSLQTVPPVIVVSPGSTGTTDINLTNLLGSNSAELTYFGEPTGVSIAFGTNPDTGSSVATVTVGSGVPAGRYTITIVGTVSSPNIEYVQLHLVVAAGGSPPPPTGVTLVAHAASVGGTSPQVTSAFNATGASFLVAIVTGFDPPSSATRTVTDSEGNTWLALTQAADYMNPQIFYAVNPTVSSSMTVSVSSSDVGGDTVVIAVAAFSGTKTDSTVYESGSITNSGSVESGTTAQAGNVTPAAIGDLIILGLGGGESGLDSPTINDSATITDNAGTFVGAALAYLVATSTSAIDPTWTVAAIGNRIGATAAVFAAA